MENLGCLASGELKNSQICPSKLRIVFKFTFSTIRQYPVEVVRFVVEVLKILEETKLNVDQCPPSHQEITSRNGVQMAFLPVYAFIELHRFPFRRSTSTVHQSQARCRTRITAYVVKRERVNRPNGTSLHVCLNGEARRRFFHQYHVCLLSHKGWGICARPLLALTRACLKHTRRQKTRDNPIDNL